MNDKLRIAIRKFPPFESAIAKQFAAFKAVSGTSCELEAVAFDLNPLADELFTSGGLRNGDWDLAFIVTDWLAGAIAAGDLLDLAPLLVDDPIPDYPEGWAPPLTRMQAINGAVYGIPYHDGPECLIYRADWFNDPSEQRAYAALHGEPLQPPTTWEQFERIARFFTRPTKDRYGTIFAAYPDGHNTVYDFCLQLWTRGGELTSGGHPALDTPAAREGLDFYRRMVNDRSVTPPDLQTIDSVKSGERFAGGSIAMMVNWFGFAAYCEQAQSPVKGKVAVAPLPAGSGGVSASLNVYWLLAIGAGSRQQETAYAFIKHCASAAMDKLTAMEGGIGCRRSTWNDPEINTEIPCYHQLAALHEHARELPRSRELPRLIHLIDVAVHRAITSDAATVDILHDLQSAAATIRLS